MSEPDRARVSRGVHQQVGGALSAELHESRTVAKRRRIAESASELFIAKGYVATSVDEIAVRADVSKQTVYKHFGSKENLFLAVTAAATKAITDELASQLEARRHDSDDVEAELVSFARTLARRVLSSEITALRRLVMAEVVHFPELGRSWYVHGPGRVVDQLTRRFKELTEIGYLSIDDLQAAAENFNWLVLSAPQNKMLFGAVDSYTDAEIDAIAAQAVNVFLAAYRRKSSEAPRLQSTGRR